MPRPPINASMGRRFGTDDLARIREREEIGMLNPESRLVSLDVSWVDPGRDFMNRELCQRFVMLRRNHAAWLLLASRNGPLTLSCLKALFEESPGGVGLDDAVEVLAEAFAVYTNDTGFNLGGGEDQAGAARKELRQWMRRGLVVEREGQLMATDALQRSIAFLDSLEDRAMTSTASRLATVQREIENLEARLSQNQASRAESLRRRIADLEHELAAVERGEFEVLEGPGAQEGIREVYQLAVSLRADFRRVEDSYREADRRLRQRIISEERNRGEIVDELLEGHEALVATPEGQVFEGFHQQLVRSAELERMKDRLRAILENEFADQALERKQKAELRVLVPRLVEESARVIQARARSERDVKAFLKSGLADEQMRVGAVLQDLFQVALEVDWSSQKVRRTRGPLPPVAVAVPNLPLIERLLPKVAGGEEEADLDFSVTEADPTALDDEFWQAYRALDRTRLFEDTVEELARSGRPLSMRELAEALPPTHDLETLSYWLTMAREAGVAVGNEKEELDLKNDEDGWTRFHAPKVELTHAAVKNLDAGEME